MLKIFVRVLFLMAVAMFFAIVIGYFLPRDYAITAEVKIAAPAEQVFDNINALREWKNWSPWNSTAVPGLEVQLSGAEEGQGAVQTWQDSRGRGKLWITDSERPERVEYKMEFGEFPEMDSRFLMKQSGRLTTVTWSSKGTLPSGILNGWFYGWFRSIFEQGLKSEYQKGLARLKKHCESS